MADTGFSRRSLLRAALLAGAAGMAGACDDAAGVLSNKLSGRRPVWKHTFKTGDTGFVTPGSTSNDLFPYSVTASGGMLYVSFEGKLYAFDTAGHEHWESPYGQYDASSQYGPTAPQVLDGVLYTVRNEPGGKGTLQALDPTTGRLVWSFSPGAWLTPPSAAGGRVVVCNMRYLYGLDAATGRQLWRVGRGSDLFLGVPAITGGTACAVDVDGILHGVTAKAGDLRWSQSDGPSLINGRFDQRSHTIGADGVFYVRDALLRAVSASDGKVRWTNGAVPDAQNAAVSSGGLLYVSGHGEHPGVLAVDAATGGTRWQAPIPDPNGTLDASPAVAGGAVSVTVKGKLVNLDAATGRPRWTALIRNSNNGAVPLSGAAAANGLVVVLCKDEADVDDAGDKDGPVDHLYAYRL
ncbi:PQQ-binding-like beta-propeller repeat protein [Actinomadura nitritigenes]|uniref:PQQ-binding-like beta-propeller repeat protein n=1 Tax=Actinomadura nitritigenes TaxID=134602 RepID=UPI003D8F1052